MRAITALTVVCLLGMRSHAANVTWTNGNGNGLWGTPTNWSTNAVPGVADVVIFDNTSSANCGVNVNANVQAIVIMGTYAGTITQQAAFSMTIGTGGFTQNNATFQGGAGNITINNGGFTLNGGVFTSTSGNLNLGGARTTSGTLFSHVGGTFNHNNGTVRVVPTCTVGSQLTYTLDVLPFTVFYNVVINTAFGWVMPVVATATGDVVNATNDLTHTDGYIVGQFAVKNNLYIGAGSDGGTGTITVDGTGAQQYSTAVGAARTCQVVVNKSAGDFTPMAGTTNFYMQSFSLLAGDFTAPSGNMNVGGTWTTSQTLFNHASGTFTHNNGTLVVNPYCSVGTQLTWTLDVLPSTAFYNVTVNSGYGWVMPLVATATGDVVNATNDLTHTDGYIIGQFAVKNNLYLGAGSDGGTGTITVDGTGAQQYSTAAGAVRTCQLVVNKSAGSFTPMAGTTDFYMQSFSLLAGDFTAPSGNMNVGGTWTTSQTLFNHGGGTFAHNNGTVVVNPYCSVGSQLTWTIDVLPTTALYNVTINSGYGWVMPLVATATGDVVNATNDLTHTDGYIIGQFAVKNNLYLGAGSDGGTGTITVDGTGGQQYSTAAGTARTCQVVVNKSAGSFTPMAGTTDFYMQSFSLLAGDFTAPSGNMNVGGTWTTSQTLFNHGGGNFTHNNGTLVVNPYCSVGTQLTWTLDVLPSTAFYNVTVNSGYGWVMPLVATATGDVVNATNDLTHTDGYIVGQFAVKNNLYLGAGSDGGTGTITADGTGAQQYSTAAGAARTCKVVVNKSAGSFMPMAGTTDFYMQSFSLLSGDFTAPSGNMNVGGTWTTSQTLFNHAGGNFTHNNGTFAVNPYCSVGTQLTWTLDVLPSTAFYNVTVNSGYGWVMPLVATAAADTVDARNDLTHSDGFITGLFEVKRNLIINAGSDGGTGTIVADGTGAQEYQIASGSPRTCKLVVNKSGGALTPASGTTDLLVQAFSLLAGDFTAPTGNLNVGGTWTTSQTLFNHSGGTFAHNSGTMVVNPYTSVGSALTFTLDVIPATTFNQMTININTGWVLPQCTIPASDSLHIDGLLLLSDGRVSTGTFEAYGDVTVASGYDGGNALLLFTGGNEQNFDLTGATGNYDGGIKLNKSAAQVTLLSNLLMDAASQTLRFQQGILNTSASTLLVIGDNVTTSGASNSSFVDGPMRKVGNDAFTFPVGDLGLYHAPLTITAPGSTSDAFTLEYIHLDPQTVPYDVTSLGAGINHVSRCEYWDLQRTAGSSNVRVTLSWDTRSCGVDQLSTMRVARWNGTQWVSHGNGGTTGSTAAGTLITAAGSTPTAYGPFTLSSSTSNNPLPIELLSFTAEPDGQVVDLAWVTATEQDNDRFVVERSADAAVFQAVLEMAGAGNSSSTLHYTGVDPRPLEGLSYYRLKQIDLDGAFSYSNVVAVQRPTYQGDAHVVLYPNPSTGDLNVRIPGASEQALVVRLFDATGRLMLEQRTATSVLHIDASALPPGTYRVVAMDGDHWSGTTSWVKQ